MGGVAIFPGIQSPHINTPVEVATQQATLGDILAQKQQREQIVQDNAIKLQQQKQAALDEQALTNHVRSTLTGGGTIEDALNTAEQNGVSATAAAKARDLHAQIRDRYATADKTGLANDKAKNNAILGDVAPILTMPDSAMQAAQYGKARNNAVAKGYIKADDPNIPQEYPGLDAMQTIVAHLRGGNEYIEGGLKAQKAADDHIAAQNNDALNQPKIIEANAKVASQLAPSLSGAQTPQLKPLYMAPGPAEGLVRPGNTDLRKLPVIENPDGGYSTVNSVSFQDERPGSPTFGKEVLVRGILNGKKVDPSDPAVLDQIKQDYYRTGQHLGVFRDGDAADAYGQRLHEDWESGKIPSVAMRQGDPNAANQQDPKQIAWSEYIASLPSKARELVNPTWSPEEEARVKGLVAKIATDTTAGEQRAIAAATGELAAVKPADKAAYQVFLDSKPAAVRAHMLAVVPVDQYDPETSPGKLDKSILTAEQRSSGGGDKNITETQLKMRAAGVPSTGNKAADQLTQAQAKAALSAGRVPNEATQERQSKDQAIQDAFRDSGYDWNKVSENVRNGKYGRFSSDIADHAEKMGKLPAPLQTKVVAADSTKQQVQAAIDGIREVVKNHPELVGTAMKHPINALIRKGQTVVGGEPADVGAVDGILETAMALQPGQHNFRSIGALAEFKKSVGIDPRTGKADGSRGWLANPDKVIAGLQSIADFNENLKKNILRTAGRSTGESAPATTPAPAAVAPSSGNHVDDWKKKLGIK